MKPIEDRFRQTSSPDSAVSRVDCWSSIGVGGDSSCGELKRHLHCRNCPVYSRAALEVLERELPEGYRRERTERFALRKAAAPATRISIVLFRVASEWFGLPAQVFQEITEYRSVHSIPHRSQGIVLGVVNVRGELLVAVALGRLLGIDRAASPEKLRASYDRLLVVAWEGKRLAFPVDEVPGIHRFSPEDLVDPPATITRAAFTFVRAVVPWRDRRAGLLNPELLFTTLNRSLT